MNVYASRTPAPESKPIMENRNVNRESKLDEWDVLRLIKIGTVVSHKDGSICVVKSFDITKHRREMPVRFQRICDDVTGMFLGVLDDITGVLVPVREVERVVAADAGGEAVGSHPTVDAPGEADHG